MMSVLFMLMLSDSCVAVRYTARLLCVFFWKYLLELPVMGADFQVQFNVFPLHRLLCTSQVECLKKVESRTEECQTFFFFFDSLFSEFCFST